MLLLVIALVPLVTNQGAPAAAQDVQVHARAVLAALTSRDYRAVVGEFNDEMKAARPPEMLEAAWMRLLAQAGAFTGCAADSRVVTISGKRMVITTCDFERGKVDIQFAFNAEGKVAGMAMRPAAAAATSAPTTVYTVPSYATAGAYSEEDVAVGGPQWPLPGTLTLPRGEGPFPALILVQGSGANDRDETVAQNKPFKDLALGLASRGIAVLRYDKRSKLFGAKMATLPSMTVKDEVIDDVGQAITMLRRRPKIDANGIFVLGHSLGGTLIPRITAANPIVAGAIVLAGAARPLEDVIAEQVKYLALADGTVSPAEQAEIDAAMALRSEISALTSADAAAGKRVFNAPAAYWLDLKGYDPPAAAASQNIPLLILQGERDYQVTMADFARWKAALGSHTNVTFKSYPSLNHYFLAGAGTSLPAEYGVPSHVDEQVVRDIAQWMLR